MIPYEGEVITQACLNQRYEVNETATYAMEAGRRRYVDSACMRGAGAMANGLFNGLAPQPLAAHNAELENRPGANHLIWLRATRDIAEGDEIFVYYGEGYVLSNDHNKTRRVNLADTRPC